MAQLIDNVSHVTAVSEARRRTTHVTYTAHAHTPEREGITWIRGWRHPTSRAARALLTAYALSRNES